LWGGEAASSDGAGTGVDVEGRVPHDEGMRAGNDRSGDGKCAGLGSWLRRARARMVSNEPEIRVCSDAARMSRLAARRVLAVVRARPDAMIGLTTGASPLGLYEELVRIGRVRPGLFRRVRWVELDEWGGLAPGEEGSNERYLWDRLLGPLGVSRRQYVGWNGMTDAPEAECRRMARRLAFHGPMDLCLLGVGADGHLAMMEPGPAVQPGPHAVRLSAGMRRHPMLGSAWKRVRWGLSLGMGDILASREIVLLACGPSKEAVLRRFWRERVVTSWFPVSFLWLHPRVRIFCDAASGGSLGVGRVK